MAGAGGLTILQATSLALDHLLRAVGDPVVELRDIGPGHAEFNRAQSIRAGAGVLAKTPDTFPAIAQAIRTAPRRRAMDARSGRPLGHAEPHAHPQRLDHAIERCAQGNDYAALRARHITRPGLRALGAWAEGHHEEAAGILEGLRPIFGDIGGSRVQLEVFTSIENEAVRRQCARRSDPPRPSSANEKAIQFIDVKRPEGDFFGPLETIAARKVA